MKLRNKKFLPSNFKTQKMDNIKFEVIKKIAETKFKYRDLKGVSHLDSNSPPSVFIGSKLQYPAVNVGILSPLEKDEAAWLYDNEEYWANQNFQIGEVINLRNSLVNSRFQAKVKDVRIKDRFLDSAKEIAMAAKPVDLEIELKNRINIKFKEDRVIIPHGMSGEMKKARLTSNPLIPAKIDKVVNDDLKASDAIEYLYKNNFSEYTLMKILSVGVLGLKKNRRLVPTRWSITTTDDILGKKLIKEIKNYRWIENFELFVGGFMGNYYLIFLFPGVWSYELFELYFPGSSWNLSKIMKASTDYEDYYGRKTYASNTAGGYYAARLPILEYLSKIKKQAGVLAIRLETPSYWASLGVWVCRESVKKTMNTRAISFVDINEALNSAKQISKVKLNFDCSEILAKSKLLKQLKTQESLMKWV